MFSQIMKPARLVTEMRKNLEKSESAFSTSGNLRDVKRCPLSDDSVVAYICVRDWKRLTREIYVYEK